MFYRHVTIRGHSAAATQAAEAAKNALSAQAAMTMQAGISNSHAKQFWSCSCCKMNASGNSHASKQNRAARADQAAAATQAAATLAIVVTAFLYSPFHTCNHLLTGSRTRGCQVTSRRCLLKQKAQDVSHRAKALPATGFQ